ncbi:hypothetical protein CEP53_010560 [Fusarium sp. AF-6]|nr:hypothetical protein CEP53_010560 [Fusarium sp. AF-6]
MAEDFGSDGFDFGSGGFEFSDSSFGGSGFGDRSFPSSSPILNNHSTFDFFGGCNPYSGFSLDHPKPSAYNSVPKGPRNYEYDFFVSNLREGDASSSSEPPMAPTSDTTFMPRPAPYGNRNQALFGPVNSGNTATAISIVERDGTLELRAGYAHGIEDGDRFACTLLAQQQVTFCQKGIQ